MGAASSSPRAFKAMLETQIDDLRKRLTRAMSRSNSLQAIDKEHVKLLKSELQKSESVLSMVLLYESTETF